MVDNASSDGSVEAVQREFPQVRTLALAQNGGYSGGCNAGVRAAQGEIVVFLNDIEAEPTSLEAAIDALDRHPGAGSAASRMMLYDQPPTSFGRRRLWRRWNARVSGRVQQPYGEPARDRECMVFGGCGGALAYHKSVLDEIGLFEESFFMYCEDVDANWRAQLAGYQCVYARCGRPPPPLGHRRRQAGLQLLCRT